MFPGSISVARDKSVGSEITNASQSLGIGYPTGTTCTVTKTTTVNGTQVPGMTGVYATNVQGIGVSWYITANWDNSFDLAPASNNLPPRAAGGAAHYTMAKLIVTGPIGSGALTSIPSMTVSFSGPCLTPLSVTQEVAPGSAIVSQSCSIDAGSKNIPVTLPLATINQFSGIGSTTSSQGFNIRLNCAAGTKVAMTLTDKTNPSNISTTLTAASSSSTQGVGIQILNGATPVAFGPDSAVAGTKNQWAVSSSTASGILDIPLTARYIKTSATIVPGNLSALATFTTSYQ
jgi:type 1 fimbria pilin